MSTNRSSGHPNRTARRDQRIKDLHEPDDEAGWTSCIDPAKTPFDLHPDNCVHGSHAAFNAYADDGLTYDEYVDRNRRELEHTQQVASDRAHRTLAAVYGLDVDEVRRRLSTPAE